MRLLLGRRTAGRADAADPNLTNANLMGLNFAGEGIVGPNLNDLPKKLAEKKFTRRDILREIIHPSEVINENFKTYQIETTKGELVTGVIVSQDDKVIRVVINPQLKPREIPIKEIEAKHEAKISLMPEGLLATMTKEEILDLLAYIISGADQNHSAFRK